MAKKTIISCAITGAINVPSMSPYLPLNPDDIIQSAVGASEAGAASLHVHVRMPETGEPTNDVNIMEYVHKGITSNCDSIVCCTTGGVIGSSIESRFEILKRRQPELATMNIGSYNFSILHILESLKSKGKEIKFDWEEKYLTNSYGVCCVNTYKDLDEELHLFTKYDTKPEFEVYDIGMIDNIKYFMDRGIIKPPVYIQFILGTTAGCGATPENLMALRDAANRILGPQNFVWSCGAGGKAQFEMCAMALVLGGNVRVGLEDNVYLKKGVLAKTNAEEVLKMKEICGMLDKEVASPDEAREILGIKKRIYNNK